MSGKKKEEGAGTDRHASLELYCLSSSPAYFWVPPPGTMSLCHDFADYNKYSVSFFAFYPWWHSCLFCVSGFSYLIPLPSQDQACLPTSIFNSFNILLPSLCIVQTDRPFHCTLTEGQEQKWVLCLPCRRAQRAFSQHTSLCIWDWDLKSSFVPGKTWLATQAHARAHRPLVIQLLSPTTPKRPLFKQTTYVTSSAVFPREHAFRTLYQKVCDRQPLPSIKAGLLNTPS